MAADRMAKTMDQELSQLDIQSTKEEEDEDDKADNEGKDLEAEKAKYLKKRQWVGVVLNRLTGHGNRGNRENAFLKAI